MQLSPLQERALRAVQAWLADPRADQIFYLAGFAGSGKTTIARLLRELVDGSVEFCAYTGKAALVLQQKSCHGARTIHSLIYTSAGEAPTQATLDALVARRDKLVSDAGALPSDAHQAAIDHLADQIERVRSDLIAGKKGPRFKLNPESEVALAKLVIADECSMVGDRVGMDLCSFGVKILALGDPAQLPPVGDGGFFTGRAPDFLLDEVHRQSADSAILWLATEIRMRRGAPYGKHASDCEVLRYGSPGLEAMAMAADQILVGRNATRHASNTKIRRLRERIGSLPVIGDRLVCLQNDHEAGVLNGSMWESTDGATAVDAETCLLKVRSLDGIGSGAAVDLSAWSHGFEGREAELSPFVKREQQLFAFGYALTVHKSQGSQWDSVIVFDESGFMGQDAWRHLYTAVTRAAKNLILVR